MASTADHGHTGLRGFVRALGHSPGLGRLLAVRLSSQITDGVFQAALFGAILFNPERHADPLAVAGGLAVLLCRTRSSVRSPARCSTTGIDAWS